MASRCHCLHSGGEASEAGHHVFSWCVSDIIEDLMDTILLKSSIVSKDLSLAYVSDQCGSLRQDSFCYAQRWRHSPRYEYQQV